VSREDETLLSGLRVTSPTRNPTGPCRVVRESPRGPQGIECIHSIHQTSSSDARYAKDLSRSAETGQRAELTGRSSANFEECRQRSGQSKTNCAGVDDLVSVPRSADDKQPRSGIRDAQSNEIPDNHVQTVTCGGGVVSWLARWLRSLQLIDTTPDTVILFGWITVR